MMELLRSSLLTSVLLGSTMCSALDASVWQFIPSFCGAATGRLEVSVLGGSPPYTYSWSTGGTDHYIHSQLPGIYSVTVTDSNMDEIAVQGEVEVRTYADFYGDYIGPPQTQAWCAGATPYAAPVGAFAHPVGENWVGPGPWTFAVNGLTTATLPNPCYNAATNPLAAQWYLPLYHPVGTELAISYSDGNGCPGFANVTVKAPIPEIPIQILSVNGSCNGMAQGSVVVATAPWVVPPYIGYDAGIAIRTAGGAFLQSACGSSGVQFILANGSVSTFAGLPPGNYEAVVRPTDPNMLAHQEYASCQSIPFTVPNLGTNCGVVTGRAFMDYNLNCTRQTNEPYVPGGIMEVLPGPYYATTNNQGLYTLTLPSGAYTITQQSEILGEHCTGGPIPFSVNNGQSTTVNLPDTSSVTLDVRTTVSSGIARPGFEFEYAMSVRNLTPAASGATSLTFTFDPTITYVSATPNPSSVSGNTITWNQTQLTAFQQRNYTVRFQVPPDVGLLGYELVANASVSTANTDGNPANNSATNLRTITGAYDPNDKLAYTSSGSTDLWLINEDEWIDYTIRFQNTGTDTAFNVVITDTLPPDLDPGTIIVGAASHNFTWELRDAGTLKFYFPNILLPDSNINEPRSHGFVGFRIRPRQPVLPGDEITNIANIYFDYNPPVITEPSVLTAVSPTRVDARAFLAGPYDAQAGLMQDLLRAQGLVPLTEPYTALGYAHTGGGGGETIAPSVLATTGATAIVDWVVLELRSAAQPATVLHSRSALLRRDGRVTDKDGTSPVTFAAPNGSYHVAIRHRNHLGVMRASPIALSSTAAVVDLTSTATTLFGSEAAQTANGVRMLWMGNTIFDGQVKYVGTSNDRDPILIAVGGSTPTNTVISVYANTDVNMDGLIKYIGNNNDRDPILQTIGGTTPTAVRTQQFP